MKIDVPELKDEDFDLTPMIDIIFLLIIFFMVVAAEITQKIEVEIPTADKAKVPDETQNRMEVSVEDDGTTYVGLVKVDMEELGRRVRKSNETMPGFKVYVRADVNSAHQHIQSVMSTCAQNGVVNIIFATFK